MISPPIPDIGLSSPDRRPIRPRNATNPMITRSTTFIAALPYFPSSCVLPSGVRNGRNCLISILAKNLHFHCVWRSKRYGAHHGVWGGGITPVFWRVNVAVACEFCVGMKRDERRTRPSEVMNCPKAYYWWKRFNADPSLNHSICGALKEWFRSNSSLEPSEWLRIAFTGWPGVRSFSPTRLIRSSSCTLS